MKTIVHVLIVFLILCGFVFLDGMFPFMMSWIENALVIYGVWKLTEM